MHYSDGSVYEGEWLRDQRWGKGLLRLGESNYSGTTLILTPVGQKKCPC